MLLLLVEIREVCVAELDSVAVEYGSRQYCHYRLGCAYSDFLF